MSITYLKGDATQPLGDGHRIIAHVCNNVGGWGRGFVVALSKRWDTPERTYRSLWHTGHSITLGHVQICNVDDDLYMANMIAQEGYGSKNANLHRTDERDARPPIRYDALKTCLTAVASFARTCDGTVHMPRIGCGLADGRWEEVEPLIEETMSDLNVFVYDWA